MKKPTIRDATADQIAHALAAAERTCPACLTHFLPTTFYQVFCSNRYRHASTTPPSPLRGCCTQKRRNSARSEIR